MGIKKKIFLTKFYINVCWKLVKKQPPRGIPRKRCSENMQQIYRRTPMPKCDFDNVAKKPWVFS